MTLGFAGTADAERDNMGRTTRLSPWVAISVVGLALLSAIATFAVLTGLTPVEPGRMVTIALLGINLLLVLALIALITWEIRPLWRARRANKAAARLHSRVVAMFCGVAAIPAVIVVVVASLTLNVGLDRWFSARTRSIVDNSATIARAYMEEHNRTIRYDILAMSQVIKRNLSLLTASPLRFEVSLNKLAISYKVPIFYLLDSQGRVVFPTNRVGDYGPPGKTLIDRAAGSTDPVTEAAEPILVTLNDYNVVGAIIELQADSKIAGQDAQDYYLYVARPVDQNVLLSVQKAESATAEYRNMDSRRNNVQAAFGITYGGIALILLLIAFWFGIAFANRLVAPIRRLIGAADRVAHGDLDVEVPVRASEGDLASLGQTFNNMTSELRSQRNDLLQVNAQLDARRLFTEAVLSGVTAGIIGIDATYKITLANPTSLALLHEDEGSVIGQPLVNVLPELAGLLNEAEMQQRLVQDEIILRRHNKEYNLLARITGEQSEVAHGYVVTLDDITDLVAAQRSSAWADVARRIAHEIKNPLTPIQLSAERLKRKYAKGIAEDEREVFDQCTDTIIRQVSDIGRMVDEFSSFARMPKAQIQEEDIGDLVRQVIFLMRVGNPEIDFDFSLPETMIRAECDRRLIGQAVTNLIKNATEAVSASGKDEKGHISVRVEAAGQDKIIIDVEDNGIGLPHENRARLLEPYMTTREKGTGLGLAIVGKVMDEHRGTIHLLDATHGHGALVRLTFPRRMTDTLPASTTLQLEHQPSETPAYVQ